MIEAKYYERLADNCVRCQLCHHRCLLKPDQEGFCRSKKNLNGTLIAIQYGLYTSIALDPMEKKPLYHFHPGSQILSIGNNSCNLTCGFCQNWQISQVTASTQMIEPQQLALLASRKHSVGVAYTYAEPLMWYEFLLDACQAVHATGLANVLVTNGSIAQAPLLEILPLIDALNVDVKSMRKEFYRQTCKGNLEEVLTTVETAKNAGCHVEITTLVIPDHNDAIDEIDDLVKWLSSIDRKIVLHFSQYHPQYKFAAAPTPLATLLRCRDQARKYLNYVYIGNVWDQELNSTYCPNCQALLIQRDGFRVIENHLIRPACPNCGETIPIIGV